MILEGAFNFRDLGGKKGFRGKAIKQGKLFRSDDLATLTDSDLVKLESLPLVTVVDFRTTGEKDAAPNIMPSTVTRYVELNVDLLNMGDEKLSPHDFMKESYKLMINECQLKYSQLFNRVQADDTVLFHCSAGKDRTGLGTALIYAALGVDEEDIMIDYMLSKKNIEPKYRNLLKKDPSLLPYFTVEKDFLLTAFQEIQKKHETVENYLTNKLNVNLEEFRKKFLELD